MLDKGPTAGQSQDNKRCHLHFCENRFKKSKRRSDEKQKEVMGTNGNTGTQGVLSEHQEALLYCEGDKALA